MSADRIVITGAGIVSPIGIGLDAFWDGLISKRSGVRSLAERTDEGAKPNSDSAPAGLWIGAPIVDFDPKLYVRPRKSLKVMCREIQTAYAASQMAMEQASLESLLPANNERYPLAHRIGTVFGSEMFYGPPEEMLGAIEGAFTENGEASLAKFGELAMREIMPLWMLKYLPNMPACHIGIAVNALGPNNSLVLGEVSGPSALVEACNCIGRDIADVIFCGASGTRINTTRMNYRGNLPIPLVDGPIHLASKPHCESATGVIGGEGAATLVLESSEAARRRGQRALAQVTATSARFVSPERSDVRRNGASTSAVDRGSVAAIVSAIQSTLDQANLTPADIALVVSQAMGDPDLDRVERLALESTLPGVVVTAPTASIGHAGAAIGTIGLVTGVLALVHRTIPPTLNADRAAASIRMLTEPASLTGDHVLCLSHTPEGHAVAVILSHVDQNAT